VVADGTLPSLAMDDFPLGLGHVRRRMTTVHRATEVVTLLDDEGATRRIDFAALAGRIDRLGGALRRLGVGPGDRVATLCWNVQEHFECYFAVPCLGAVLHTANVRLSAEQIAWTINDAGDRVLIVDAALADLAAEIAGHRTTVEHVVVTGDAVPASLRALPYESLLAAEPEGFDWPEVGETAAAALCYTSGTTGDPKGVLYSHRALVLQALTSSTVDAFGIGGRDRLLAVVPMFHAMGWGLPYICGMVGADLILPGRRLQAPHLASLIERERVTYACGVPTIWADLLRHVDETGADLSTLRRAPCGGSAVSIELMQAFDERHGVEIVQGWGMTECLAGAAVAADPGPEDPRRWEMRTRAGRAVPLVEARVVGEDGRELLWDDESSGELQVRGPVAARRYYSGATATTPDGWMRTGDVATIHPDGWIRIVDRVKDVIKSGGEWISSIELEAALSAHPDVREVAVIARPDERWGERPVVCVTLARAVAPSDLRARMAVGLPRWQLPDDFAVLDELPRTSVGKLDKKALRRLLEAGDLPFVTIAK
jgi:fatty-acyl-CoA synthase